MFSKALLILSVVSVAFATVYVTAPVAATVYSGGQPATISWQDSGSPPTLAQFGNAKISIYAGNAQQQTSLQLVNASVNVATVSSISFTPQPNIGPNSNHYLIRFESLSLTDPTQSQTTALAFSAQFTLNNMTGTFSAAVLSEIAGQSTAPLGAPTSSSAGPTSIPSITTSQSPTAVSSSTPSATKSASGAMGIKAGWAGAMFWALVGFAMF